MRNFINITESYVTESLAALKAVKISDIDIDEALKHFDIPVGDVSPREMRAAFKQTKLELINLFKGMGTIVIYRGLIVDPSWTPENSSYDGLGKSWAWDVDGALKGSGIKYWTNKPNGDLGLMIKAEVSPQYIDWETTIAVNSFHEDEQEIVVKSGAPIKVTSMVVADKFGVDETAGVISTPNQMYTA